MNLLLRTFAVLFALGSFLTARADLFTFNFAGQGQSASGSLTANATGNPGQFLISSISGTLNSSVNGTLTTSVIAGLLAPGGFAGNDNLLNASGTGYIPDAFGFSFSLVGGVRVNVFTFGTAPFAGQQFLLRSDGIQAQMTTFQITPVPEPAAWMLLGTGVLGAMRAVRRRVLV